MVRNDLKYCVRFQVSQYSSFMSAHNPSRVGRPGSVQTVKIVAPPSNQGGLPVGGTVDMVTLTSLINAHKRSMKRRHRMADIEEIEECTYEPTKRGRLALTL